MLLTGLISNEQGELQGISEGEGFVTLSCLNPRVFYGGGDYSTSTGKLGKSLLMSNLLDRARKDGERYYFVGKPEYTEERDLCIIPYLIFNK